MAPKNVLNDSTVQVLSGNPPTRILYSSSMAHKDWMTECIEKHSFEAPFWGW